MKVCVVGLWHLGSVTAACLASGGHQVCGLDFDSQVIHGLNQAKAPLFEPGLDDLIKTGIQAQALSFTTNPEVGLQGAAVIWVTYDTPVDDEDHADVEYVVERVSRLFPYLKSGQEVLISSQLPVGSTKRIQKLFEKAYPDQTVNFSYSPENLRLGKAISVFSQPDRVVIGTLAEKSRAAFKEMLAPFTDHIEWMSVESAEMTKHALNAFLAVSVTFINEIASICEKVGADAKEVERGLKSETRIGPKAYLGPGGAFAGGTLARDIAFLTQLCQENDLSGMLLNAVATSNTDHKGWPSRRLTDILGGSLDGKSIAVWGLTYKPGTDTLRRSTAVELCRWLVQQGAAVNAHDPAVKTLPSDLAGKISLCANPLEALQNADALVVATEWPDYAAILPSDVVEKMKTPYVIDANRFLGKTLGVDPNIHLFSVGKAS